MLNIQTIRQNGDEALKAIAEAGESSHSILVAYRSLADGINFGELTESDQQIELMKAYGSALLAKTKMLPEDTQAMVSWGLGKMEENFGPFDVQCKAKHFLRHMQSGLVAAH